MIIDGEDDKILRPDFGEAKLVVDHSERSCMHEYVCLRRYSQTVICRICKAEVEPFDVLLVMARNWDCATYRSQEIGELYERIAELKREESNIKSRLRSAHKLAVPEAKAQVFFDEVLRRLSEACSWGAIRDAERFAAEFKWLEPVQYKALADARFAAEQRSEAANRASPKRKRAVRVIAGGKGK